MHACMCSCKGYHLKLGSSHVVHCAPFLQCMCVCVCMCICVCAHVYLLHNELWLGHEASGATLNLTLIGFVMGMHLL